MAIVPNLMSDNVDTASIAVRFAGLFPKASGDGSVVIGLDPGAGTHVLRGSIVKFHLRHTGGLPP